MIKKRYAAILILCLLPQGLFAQKDFFHNLADSAVMLTHQHVVYDPTYFIIKYPNGDVPTGKGVCTDVIIRSYRKFGIDLQQRVHEDMAKNFSKYPKRWKLKGPDKNIDHRRVPNLMVFFSRFGEVKKITQNPFDYIPGDMVCWDLGGGITHIGMVVNAYSSDKKTHLIVHNIGGGQVLADCLFSYKIIGHYRYK